MRIAYCCNSYWSPSETFLRDLVAGLDSEGHQVFVFANQVTSHGLAERSEGVTICELGFFPRGSWVDRIAWFVARRWKRFAALGYYASGRRRARAVLKTRLKTLNPDVIYCEYGQTGILLMDVAEALRIPLVVHFHGADASAAMAQPEYVQAVAQLIATAKAVIVPSEHVRRLLVGQCGYQGRFEVIPCEPKAHFSSRAAKATRPLVVTLGRLTGKKHPLAVLEAFWIVAQAVPEAHLVMIGDGPLRERVEERIRQLRLSSRVELLGALDHVEALRRVQHGWVFVQHSVTAVDGDQEGQPVSIMEAMALEVPPVATVHSGIPEMVDHGENGFLVREHDFESMAEYVIKLLNSEELRTRMGIAARLAIGARFSKMSRPKAVLEVLGRVCVKPER